MNGIFLVYPIELPLRKLFSFRFKSLLILRSGCYNRKFHSLCYNIGFRTSAVEMMIFNLFSIKKMQ